jgi:hypothetical protein
MDTVVKTVNFIDASAVNHHEFVELLGEAESEHGKIIYHTNVADLLCNGFLIY